MEQTASRFWWVNHLYEWWTGIRAVFRPLLNNYLIIYSLRQRTANHSFLLLILIPLTFVRYHPVTPNSQGNIKTGRLANIFSFFLVVLLSSSFLSSFLTFLPFFFVSTFFPSYPLNRWVSICKLLSLWQFHFFQSLFTQVLGNPKSARPRTSGISWSNLPRLHAARTSGSGVFSRKFRPRHSLPTRGRWRQYVNHFRAVSAIKPGSSQIFSPGSFALLESWSSESEIIEGRTDSKEQFITRHRTFKRKKRKQLANHLIDRINGAV